MSESPTHSIKRERDHDNAEEYAEQNDREFGMPPNKKDTPQAIMQALQFHSQQMQNSFYNTNGRRATESPVNIHHHRMSPSRNGADNSPSTSASNDLSSTGSSVALLAGMQFKLSSRGN